MPLFTQLPNDVAEVDVIIAGGGATGCVVAARLADTNPNLSILIIEGGPNNDMPTVAFPRLFAAHILPETKTNIFYQGNKVDRLGDRVPVVQSGGLLGGGSSTNMMAYSRAQRSDFDAWNMPGWSAEDMLPYMKRLETYHGPGDKVSHGQDSPIYVSGGTWRSERFESDFIKAFEKAGWPEIEDMSNMQPNNGVWREMRFKSPDGKRQDVVSRYLLPKLQSGKHPEIHVLVEHQVVRVLFDNSRATGVEFRPNPLFQSKGPRAPHLTRNVRARRMIILSCGACGTPSVLERSGVGNTEVLQRAGIELVDDVPGVGNEYDDHQLILCSYKSSLRPDETLDALMAGRLDPAELIQKNDKMLGSNGQEVQCKLRPTENDISALGPEFLDAWNRDFKNVPDKPLIVGASLCCFPGVPIGIPPGQYFAVSTFTVHPYSRGHLHVTGPSLDDPLDFETGFFADPKGLDLKAHMWAYKRLREVIRRMDVYRGEIPVLHPPFAPGSAAACVELDGPLGADVAPIEYTAGDDAVLEKWLRENVGTTWHSMGTCKMAPREKMGVVDASLSVYGVQGLKIADMSIAPSNVGANTYNTALAIGEKAADLFIHELDLAKK